MGEKAAMTDKDQRPTQGTDQDIKPKHPHRSIMEYMDAIEQAAPADKAARTDELIRAIDPTGQSIKQLAEEINRTAKIMQKVQPFLDAIFEAYPVESWFMYQSIGAILSPIGAFMQDRGLHDGADMDAHKADFLAFFQVYISETETAYNEDPNLDLEALQDKIFKNMVAGGLLKEYKATEITRTVYPLTLAAPIDKMSKFAFAGLLTEKLQPLAMEGRKSKREVTTLASVNFSAPQLQGVKGLTHYDEAVYNAICSLYTSGNEYMTVQMIYQAMRGDNEARISPAQAAGIRGSVTKFMYGGAYIDATEEAARYKIKGSAIYDSNFINAERVTHNLNGTITECIHLLKTPVLLEYASSKNQIGRAPIKALATPVDKTEETFALQAYLLERIFAMRGTDPQRDIAYNSIYNAVWDKEAASKETQSGYIRVKKSRLKKKVFSILDHWTTEGTAKDGGRLIQSFEEYKHGVKKTAQGIRISL